MIDTQRGVRDGQKRAARAVVCAGVAALLAMSVGCERSPSGTSVPPVKAEQDYRRVAPELVLYEELPRIETGFKETYAIAVGPEDFIYATGDQRLIVLNREGGARREVNLSAAARGVGVDARGDIYLGVGDHVKVYDQALTQKAVWPSFGERAVITSVAVGDEVFAGDYGNRLVWRCDKSGKVLGRIGENDKLRFCPCISVVDVTLRRDGGVWITDHKNWQVLAYDKEGSLQTRWGQRTSTIDGFSGGCNPTHIAIGADGEVFTSEKDIERIKVSTPDGTLLGVVAPPSSFALKTVGVDLAVDSQGRVLALDPVQKAIRVFVKK